MAESHVCDTEYFSSGEEEENVPIGTTRSGLGFKPTGGSGPVMVPPVELGNQHSGDPDLECETAGASAPSGSGLVRTSHSAIISEEREKLRKDDLAVKVRRLENQLLKLSKERDEARMAAFKARDQLESNSKGRHSNVLNELGNAPDPTGSGDTNLSLQDLQRRLRDLEMGQCKSELENKENVPTSGDMVGVGRRRTLSRRSGGGREPERETSSDSSSDRSLCSSKVWKRSFRRPDPFSGEQNESWPDWQAAFERKLQFAGVTSDKDRVMFFTDSIKGSALRFFNKNLSHDEQSSWRLCKERFQARFGISVQNARGRAELAEMSLRKGESAMAFCQRFIEAWEKVYTSTKVETSSQDPYVVDKFIYAIGIEPAIMHVACQPHETLDEVCQSLQLWLDANSFAEQQRFVGKNKLRLEVPDLPVYTHQGDKTLRDSEIIGQLKALQKAASQAKGGLKSQRKLAKKAGVVVDDNSMKRATSFRIPNWAKVYKLKEPVVPGACWFCGEKVSPRDHNVRNCPIRRKMEENNPGSTYVSNKVPSKVQSEN